VIPMATRLARAGFADAEAPVPDPWPSERRVLLAELRRRIESLERRPKPDPDAGPRLPPAALAHAAPRQRCLGELDGAEEVAWGARVTARMRPLMTAGEAIVAATPSWLARLGGSSVPLEGGLAGVRILDCETTGLAGGTGTLAFLVGIGRFEPDGMVHVEQLLLRGPACEAGFLDHLLHLLGGASALVTFNGRAFDGPLLRTRCVLQRRRAGPLAALPHVDLLPMARRMWRGRADDCRLISLEERVLRRRRAEDFPGALAPAAYAAFLRGGDAAALAPIVTHNRDDIVGTAALLVATLRILADPLGFAEDAAELRAAAAQREIHDGLDAAVPLYVRALEIARGPILRRKLLGELATALRRSGRWDLAGEQWTQYAREFPNENRGFVELAKLLERRRRDPVSALGVIARAPHPAAVDVERRRTRLERRVARHVVLQRTP